MRYSPFRLVRIVLFQILAIVLLLALAEGILRFVKVTPTTEVHAVFRPELVGDYEPNIQAKNSFFIDRPYSFKTNSQGVRSLREISKTKPPDTIRILCLGDSFTMGWGVNDEFIYPEQLFQLIKEQHPNVQVEVINVGGIWSNVLDQIDYYREKGSKLEPDLVISQFFSNDIYHEMAREVVSREVLRNNGGALSRLQRILQGTALYNAAAMIKYKLLKQNVEYRDGRKVPQALHDKIAPNDYNSLLVQVGQQEALCLERPDTLFDEYATPCISRLWDNYLLGLGILRKDVEKSGAKFLFVAIPDRTQMNRYLNAHSCVLGAYCSQAGIPFLDMLPIFRSAYMGRDSELYISDGHANEKGNYLIAASISKMLKLFKRDEKELVVEVDDQRKYLACSATNRYRLTTQDGKLSLAPVDVHVGFDMASKVISHNIAIKDSGTTLGLEKEELGSGAFKIMLEAVKPVRRVEIVAMPRIYEDALEVNAVTIGLKAEESISSTTVSYVRSSGSRTWKDECAQIKSIDLIPVSKQFEITVDMVGNAGVKVNSSMDRNAHRVFDVILFQTD